jgi:hypothetical protein
MNEETKQYYEAFTEQAREQFSYLLRMGYKMNECEVVRTELIEYWNITFDNKTIDRQVSVSFTPDISFNKNWSVNTIGVSIYKSNGVISFEYYLTRFRQEIDQRMFALENYQGTIDQKFRQAMAAVSGLLEDELLPVLSGSEWIADMYPDWRG